MVISEGFIEPTAGRITVGTTLFCKSNINLSFPFYLFFPFISVWILSSYFFFFIGALLWLLIFLSLDILLTFWCIYFYNKLSSAVPFSSLTMTFFAIRSKERKATNNYLVICILPARILPQASKYFNQILKKGIKAQKKILLVKYIFSGLRFLIAYEN